MYVCVCVLESDRREIGERERERERERGEREHTHCTLDTLIIEQYNPGEWEGKHHLYQAFTH